MLRGVLRHFLPSASFRFVLPNGRASGLYVSDRNGVASTTGPSTPTCEQVNQKNCPTGSVTLTSNGSPLNGNGGVFNLNNDGYTRDLVPTLAAGTYSLVAQYSGDASYQSSIFIKPRSNNHFGRYTDDDSERLKR